MDIIAQSIVASMIPYLYLANVVAFISPKVPQGSVPTIGLLMVVVGIVMILKTNKERVRKWWILTLVFGGVLVGLSLALAISSAKKVSRSVQCSSCLHVIGKTCHMYLNHNKGKMPLNLEILMETHDLVPMHFICPSSCDKEGESSYVYRGADLDEWSSSQMVIAYDKKNNHRGIVRNVLFMDSHVKKYTEEMFQDIIARDNEIRREMGLPEKEAID